MTDIPEVTYTGEEFCQVHSLVGALRRTNRAVFTAASLADDLAAWECIVKPEHRTAFHAALAKLRQEPPAKLAAWLNSKATWKGFGGGRFGLVYGDTTLSPGETLEPI
jgi:hypothetical protein